MTMRMPTRAQIQLSNSQSMADMLENVGIARDLRVDVDRLHEQFVQHLLLHEELRLKLEDLQAQVAGIIEDRTSELSGFRTLDYAINGLRNEILNAKRDDLQVDQLGETQKGEHHMKQKLELEEALSLFKHELRVELNEAMEERVDSIRKIILPQIDASKAQEEKPEESDLNTHTRTVTMEEVCNHTEYSLKSSVWDVSFFVFSNTLGVGASLQVLVLLLLTVGLQLSFAIIAESNLTSATFTGSLVEELANFRHDIAHDVRYRNPVTHMPLAGRLCDRSEALEMAGTQLAILEEIDGYLGTDSAGDKGVLGMGGITMCILALFSWSLVLLGEVASIADALRASLGVPRGQVTALRRNSEDEGVALIGWSCCRFFWVCFILFLRFSVCASLFFIGGLYLAVDTSVGDLLLNTVALAFLLDLSGMIFVGFAPDASKHFVERLTPLQSKRWFHVNGFEMWAFARCIIAVAYVLLIYIVVVRDQVTYMKEAKEVLCGDSLNFIYTLDEANLVYAERVFETGSQIMTMTRDTIATLVSRGDSASLNSGFAIGTMSVLGYSVQQVSSTSRADLIDLLNPYCKTLIGTSDAFDYAGVAKTWIGFSVEACDFENPELMQACQENSVRGALARSFCPNECQCDTPFSPTFSSSSHYGCPSVCTEVARYAMDLSRATCRDWILPELEASGLWGNWTDFVGSGSSDLAAMKSQMLSAGCRFLGGLVPSLRISFCTGSLGLNLRALGPVCPVSCGCDDAWNAVTWNEAMQKNCPPTCHNIVRLSEFGANNADAFTSLIGSNNSSPTVPNQS